MDLAERLVSASEPRQVGTGVEQQVASGDEIAQRVIREAGQKEIGGTEREIRTSSQREHNLSNSNALLTSALFSSRPKKLIGEIISLKIVQNVDLMGECCQSCQFHGRVSCSHRKSIYKQPKMIMME